jgi:hypothetical protein
MPLLNVNPMTKSQYQSTLKTIMNECKRCIIRWDEYVQAMDRLTDAEMKALPVAQGEPSYNDTDVAYIRSALGGLKNVVRHYHNQEKLGTDDPSYFIEFIADPIVF